MPHTIVPGHGPKTSTIALVAEHPGAEEILYGIPLCGSSGKLLCSMLRQAGIRRAIDEKFISGKGYSIAVESDIYCTNLIKFLPPEAGFEKTFYLRKREPTGDLLTAYTELADELSEMPNLNLIIAAGDHALQALTGKRGITSWAGSVIPSTLLPGKKVLPIMNPAAIMREYYYRTLTVLYLKRAKEQASFSDLRRPERSFLIDPTLADLHALLPKYLSAAAISWDIEIKGRHIACVGFACSPWEAVCVPFISESGNYWSTPEDEAGAWWFCKLLLESAIPKIAQNCLFDCSHMATHGIYVRNQFEDTMLRQNILYPELEKSLAILCAMYTLEPYYKADGRAALRTKSDKAWAPGQKDSELRIYNLKDCCVTYEALLEQLKDFTKVNFHMASVQG